MHRQEDTPGTAERPANFASPSEPSPRMSDDERPSPFAPMLLAWLLPGAGHWKLGRPWPALFIALAVIPIFVLGMVLTGYENVSWERHPYYFALQAPAGIVAFAGEFLSRGMLPDRAMPHAAVGTLYSAVAGLLNLMAIADVWARTQRGDPEVEAERAKAAAEAERAENADPGALGA